MDYDWPGNVRELENVVKRYVVLGDERYVQQELRERLETSPGTFTVVAWSGVPPVTLAESPSRSTVTPKPLSIRSVWSRLGIGSRTVVRPSACRPANRIAVFTCALATGKSCAKPRSEPPVIVIGALPPVVSTLAPMARSGAATR